MAIHGNPGGFVTAATPTVTTSSAQGIWTKTKQLVYKAAGSWPSPSPVYELWAWGDNSSGNLGQGNTTSRSSPVQVGALTTWVTINGSSGASFAIKTNGTFWAWGRNGYGLLGLGNTTYYSSPKQVGALTAWSSVVSEWSVSTAIKTDGTLWIWGYNHQGQLGLGNITDYSSPKQVGALTNWSKTAVSNGRGTLAVKTDGTLWAWGYNGTGILGLNNLTNYSSPKQVGSLTSWANVTTSYAQSFAVKTDGTLWSWGRNSYGQLGDGTTTNRSSPVQIGALTNWSKIPVGNSSRGCTAIKTDGTLWSWGSGSNGKLGLGNTTSYSSPKQVGALTTWSNVSGAAYRMTALKTDGTIWAWGSGAYGQLGLGNTTSYSSPKQVGALTTWTSISAGYSHTLALKSP